MLLTTRTDTEKSKEIPTPKGVALGILAGSNLLGFDSRSEAELLSDDT